MSIHPDAQGRLQRSKHDRSQFGKRRDLFARSAIQVSRRVRSVVPLLEPCEARVLLSFALTKLHLGSATGLEDYVYTVGNKVVPQESVDAGKYYDVVVTDSNGLQRSILPRT